jgi:hypothetical protein
MLQGVWARFPFLSHSLEWTKAHPERKKPENTWTPADVGIHTADLIAVDPATLALRHPTLSLTIVDADQVHCALIPEGTWVWKDSSHLFTNSLKHHVQRHHFQTYLTTLDTFRDPPTPNGRWTQYSHPLMATLIKPTNTVPLGTVADLSSISLTGWPMPPTSPKASPWTLELQHPSVFYLAKLRPKQTSTQLVLILRSLTYVIIFTADRLISTFLPSDAPLFPPNHQWIQPILAFVETHLWDDTEIAGDIWNGPWSKQVLTTILGESCSMIIHPKDFSRSLRWLVKRTAKTPTDSPPTLCPTFQIGKNPGPILQTPFLGSPTGGPPIHPAQVM